MFLQRLFIILTSSNLLLLQSKSLSFRTFDVLRNADYFIDKTDYIREFLQDEVFKHRMWLGRRGFGKTTNLDMIRRFVEIDVFPNGSIKTDKSSFKNYKTFADIVPSTGKHLTIFTNKSFFEKHFGEYPVIWLDLDSKGVKTYNEIDLMRQLLNTTIRSAFGDHVYLLNSSKIAPKDKEEMKKFLAPNLTKPPDFHDYIRAYSPRRGIMLLKKLLASHFKKDAIGLVDNADAPLRDVIFDPGQRKDDALEKLFEPLSGILEAFKDFEEYSGIQATHRTALTGVFPLQPYFRIYFPGFREEEVKLLLELGRTKAQKLNEISAWYGGFVTNKAGSYSYNPYSLVQFLTSETKALKPYWSGLGALETFKTALTVGCFGQQVMECLERGELPTASWLCGSSHPGDVIILKKLQMLKLPILASTCSIKDLNVFVSFLKDLGYLTFRSNVKRPYREGLRKAIGGDDAWCEVFAVTNLEVRSDVTRVLFEAVVSEVPLNGVENFRHELFGAVTGVDGSEPSLRRFGDVLVKLLVASGSGNTALNVSLAHSVRAQLLHPPPQFTVKYVKTGRSEEEHAEGKNRPEFDLVFVVQGVKAPIGFVVKFESVEEGKVTKQTLTDAYLNVFASGDLKNVTDPEMEKLVANLSCDKRNCKLSYLYNSTNLDQENHIQIERR